MLKHMHLLHASPEMKPLFPQDSMFPAFKRGQNLKNILAPSRFPRPTRTDTESGGCLVPNGSHCDLCKFLVPTSKISSTATNQTYKIKPSLDCNSNFVIYCITDLVCKKQNVGSCDNIKSRLSNYKSHLKHHKVTCSFVKHFWETDLHKSVHPVPSIPKDYNELLHQEMEIFLIDQRLPKEGESKKVSLAKLRKLEGDWQAKLHTYEPQGLNIRGEFKA